MKEAEHKEIDLLLRSLAKRKQVGALAESSAGGEHLDTDELNAYAEGLLSPAARARFTAHLADCRRCRVLVTQLTLFTGPVVPGSKEKKTASFWQQLMQLFSPPVLRYAIPLVALLAVIAVSIIALRQQRMAEFVAQRQPDNVIQPEHRVLNEPSETQASQNSSKGSSASAPVSTRSESQNRTNTTSTTNSRMVGDTSGSADKESVEVKKQTELGGAKPAAAGAQPSYAPEVTAAPPAPRQNLQLEDAKTGKLAKQQEGAEREARAEPALNEGQARAKDKDKDDRFAAPRPQSAPAVRGNNQALRVGRADEKGRSKEEDQTEIRTVAGRQFRLQGNAWVDTAYNPPRATVNVSRGSEQYRALIADEPTLRVIAEQLAGEVIVVWHGRAYRIR